uniref:Predicted protein n=1 Tax=Hordeum vulgare subsp. vulgare TaxID=112509 RepID=F2D1K1_HORVV|nr:predicted protein [Hordeum vulgare subsp. vulgare]
MAMDAGVVDFFPSPLVLSFLAYCCVVGGRDEAGVVVTDEPTTASRPLPADVGRGRRWSMLLRAPRCAPPPRWVPSVAP